MEAIKWLKKNKARTQTHKDDDGKTSMQPGAELVEIYQEEFHRTLSCVL